MEKLKFLSNTYDPKRPNARRYFVTSYEGWRDPGKGEWEWQQHLNWIAQNRVGRPMASDSYTTEQLEEMGMVGIYSPEKQIEQ